MLKDKEIRDALIRHLTKRRPAPTKILEELRVHNGNAIADVVAFHKEIHCYEIKGETDSIQRLTKQAGYYNVAFPKITVVTTKNHITWANNNLPHYWGIIIANEDKNRVTLKYYRKAKTNPDFRKEKALMALWKDELVQIANTATTIRVKSSHTRQELAHLMSEIMKKEDTIQSIRAAMLSRESRLF